MKTIMSIEEYKLYKNGQLSIMDLKMKNIKGSKLYSWGLNHKELLANATMFGIIVTSNIIASANMISDAKTVDDILINLYFIAEEALAQDNPDEWLRAYFSNGGKIFGN